MTGKALGTAAFLAWTFVVLAVYYVFHKPVSTTVLIGGLKTLWAFALATTILTLAAGLGRAALGRAWQGDLSHLPPIERVAVEAGLGIGLVSLVWLGFGLAGALRTEVAWGLILVLAAAAGRSGMQWLRTLATGLRTYSPRSREEWALAAFVALMVLTALLWALAPPTGWDSLLYHLTGPREDIALGRLQVDPALPETGYPQVVEMLYLWALLVGNVRAAAPLHWAVGLLLASLVLEWGHRRSGSATGWWAAAILLSTTSLAVLMRRAYVDLVTIFYGAVGFALLLRWRDAGRAGHLLLAGLMAGFAYGTKYTGGAIGIALAAVMAQIVVAQGAGGRPAAIGRRMLRSVLLLAGSAALAALPWVLKSLTQTGSPTYPFFFTGFGWDRLRLEWQSRPGSGLWATAPWQLLAAPFIIGLFGAEGRDIWHATVGPLWLLLLPALALDWRRRPARLRGWVVAALGYTGVLYGFWLWGAAESSLAVQPRLLFPILPVLAVLAALGFDALARLTLPRLSAQRVVAVAVALVLVLTAVEAGLELVADGPLPVLVGLQSEDEYLYGRLGWHYAAMKSIEALPAGSQVLFLFEPRSFYCPPARCTPDGVLDRWWHTRRRGVDASVAVAEWRAAGVTHVLAYALGAEVLKHGNDPFEAADWLEYDRLHRDHLSLIENFGNAYLLYELAPK